MARQSIVASAIVVLGIAQFSCVTTKFKYRKVPIYEMRRVHVGTRDVPRRERVQVGERPVTTIVREPVQSESGTESNPSEFVERTVTTMEPIFKERSVMEQVPNYEWQRFTLRVGKHKYEVTTVVWHTLVGGALAVTVVGALAFVLAGPMLAPIGPP